MLWTFKLEHLLADRRKGADLRDAFSPLEAVLGQDGLRPPPDRKGGFSVTSATDFPSPPAKWDQWVGHGGREVGRFQVAQLRRWSKLEPGERLLDMGCGIGRTAVWLTPFLGDGSYEGFDVNPEVVRWCEREITPRDRRFRFSHVDVRNAAYNPQGSMSALDFRFPYEDESFDVAAGFSLFTHLLADEFAHYLAEARRVLRPGGRLHSTVFLLTPERLRQFAQSDAPMASRLMATDLPIRGGLEGPAENMVAYEESFARKLLADRDLELELIHLGGWHRWAMGLDRQLPQDTIVAVRPD